MKLLPYLLLALLATSCYKTEHSGTLTEDAVVDDTFFIPTSHNLDGDGDIETVPQKFGVLFRCQHGKFTIEGSSRRHADLWKKMVVGHPVTITYREIYHVTKKGTNFHDYDFIDANPIKLGEL